jgi:hypothetical protein
MAGEQDKLRETLDELRAQLDDIRQRDPALAAQLDATVARVNSVLTARTVDANEQRSIVKRLSDAVQKYEASHPTLAASLGSIIDALAQMGI